jgi:hypothetical protein
MKTGRRRSFWPLSPTATAENLERTCWLAVAGLVLALALAPAPVANPSARPLSGVAPEKVSILILQRRCIDRILGQAQDMSEEAAVERINRECWAPRGPSPATRGVRLSCERPGTVRVTPAVKRVAGCLGS